MTDIVHVENLVKRYDDLIALDHFNLSIAPGEIFGLLGPNGSGKTTSINCILQLLAYDKGTIELFGEPMTPARYDLKRRIGVVPQKAVLFKGTIRENLLWGDPNASEETLHAALRAAQAEEIVAGKENGLDYEIEQGGRNLSGGQRQRLTIARALVRRPEILILDDSASALDFATDAALRKALRALPEKPTVVIVSQRTSSIRHADEILVLDNGRLVGRGTHDELLRSCAVYREIHESQFKKEEA